ncbi:MAG: hypothetical protein ACK5NW_01085 [Ottowia sp.]
MSEERQAIDAANHAAGEALAAQAPADDALLAPWLAAERTRIGDARRAAQQQFDEAERACWRRFTVNACISDARIERRATTDRLRQEDLALNAVERQRRTAERLRTLDQKQQDAEARQGARP